MIVCSRGSRLDIPIDSRYSDAVFLRQVAHRHSLFHVMQQRFFIKHDNRPPKLDAIPLCTLKPADNLSAVDLSLRCQERRKHVNNHVRRKRNAAHCFTSSVAFPDTRTDLAASASNSGSASGDSLVISSSLIRNVAHSSLEPNSRTALYFGFVAHAPRRRERASSTSDFCLSSARAASSGAISQIGPDIRR